MSAASEALGIYDYGISWGDSDAEMAQLLVDLEDLQEVATLDDGGYSWSTLRSFWSPSRRRYLWVSGSGCSCNSLRDEIRSIADFEEGGRQALKRALRAFADERSSSFQPGDLVDALGDVEAFTEVRA